MKKLLIIFKILILTFFISIISILSIYVYAFITPKFNINTNDIINYYDKNNNRFFDIKENEYISLDKISPNIKNAIISIEDKNFYSHNGFDCLRIIKAILINIKAGKIKQGASTISQQYIKNLYLTFDKTWKRKIEEAFLTIELETHYSKDEILEGYLNTIDFGAGNYGIKEASHYYFNKEPKDLSLSEATLIVGIPKSPSYYNPIKNFNNAKERQKEILISMYKNGYINKEDIDKTYNEDVVFYGKYQKQELSSIYYYKDAVLNELSNLKVFSNKIVDMNKINIYTNLDLDAQKVLEENTKNETSNTSMQTSSIIIEPKNGRIVALIGGNDYEETQYNRAIYSKRQVGSTIKPFLYYSALENGFTPSSTFLSEKTTFNINGENYTPSNAGNVYAGKNISMLLALSYSDNVYAMKTHLFLGEESLSNIIKRVKIKEDVKENPSSALGTTEINIIDYSNGFITLANEGNYIKPHIIEKITDEYNNIIYEFKYEEEKVLNNKYVYILNNLLTSTYDYKLVSYTSPTLISISNLINGKYAVKSGSTQSDYWTIGYNHDYLVMVWAGNDDNSNVKSSDSKITKKIWANTIENLNNNNKTWYEIPEGITISTIDPFTGKFKENGYVCYYEKGSEPNFDYEELKDIFGN